MQISKKTYYAMRALAFLAKKNTPCSMREVSEHEKLPLDYLEKIFQALRKADIVDSIRGATGGYILAYPAEEITLHDIFSNMEGSFFSLPCLSPSGCSKSHSCHTKNVWDTINRTLDEKLKSITLKDIIS